MARANGRFDVRSALTLHEEREVDMLASLYLNANGHGLRVAELPKALQPLELCDGIPDESIEQVVHQTMSRLGHSKSSLVDHDTCVAYYNSLVEFINSYEARLNNPSRNCTPQYTVAGLDMPTCFWINLDRSPDRRTNMQRLLKGYRHERVPAVDAQGPEWEDVATSYGLDRELKATPGERCCTLSHVRALEAIQRAGVDVALVLEDDVTFKFIPPTFSFEKTVSSMPDDWDVCHISARSNPPSKLLNIPYMFCEWRPKLCFSTAAFLINGKHIDEILRKVRTNLQESKEVRADWVLYGSCRTYILTRPILDEDPFRFSSAIHSENEEYHRRMHVALSELYRNEVRIELGLEPLPLTYAKGYKSGTDGAPAPAPEPEAKAYGAKANSSANLQADAAGAVEAGAEARGGREGAQGTPDADDARAAAASAEPESSEPHTAGGES